MTNLKIRSIRKGWGTSSHFWEIGDKYARIDQERKLIQIGEGMAKELIVYRIYDQNDLLKVEIEAASELTITYTPVTD